MKLYSLEYRNNKYSFYKEKFYCYASEDLSSSEIDAIEHGNFAETMKNCSKIIFMIREIYPGLRFFDSYLYKYDRINNTLLHETLYDEESWTSKWFITDEEKCIIKFADGQEEGSWGYFNVNEWKYYEEEP